MQRNPALARHATWQICNATTVPTPKTLDGLYVIRSWQKTAECYGVDIFCTGGQ